MFVPNGQGKMKPLRVQIRSFPLPHSPVPCPIGAIHVPSGYETTDALGANPAVLGPSANVQSQCLFRPGASLEACSCGAVQSLRVGAHCAAGTGIEKFSPLYYQLVGGA